MNRKTFIWTSLVAAGSVVPILIYRIRKQKLLNRPLAYPSFLASFMEENTIRKIGITYRLMNRPENNQNQLEKLLLQEVSKKNDQEKKSLSLIEEFENITTKNFEQHKIIIADGWVLSVTEARQCALFSFTQ
jgi:hypothetical protein